MRSPNEQAIEFAYSESALRSLLSALDVADGEVTSLRKGDRVFFITVDGEFPAAVLEDWEPPLPPNDPDTPKVRVTLDACPERHIAMHRTLFRSFTALDHLSEV